MNARILNLGLIAVVGASATTLSAAAPGWSLNICDLALSANSASAAFPYVTAVSIDSITAAASAEQPSAWTGSFEQDWTGNASDQFLAYEAGTHDPLYITGAPNAAPTYRDQGAIGLFINNPPATTPIANGRLIQLTITAENGLYVHEKAEFSSQAPEAATSTQ